MKQKKHPWFPLSPQFPTPLTPRALTRSAHLQCLFSESLSSRFKRILSLQIFPCAQTFPPGSAYSRACEPVHSMVEGNNVGVLTFSGIFVVLERLDRAPSRRNSLSWRNLCNHCGVGWIILQRVLAQPQPSLLSPCHCFPRDPIFCGFIRAKEAPHPVQLGECPFQAQHPAMSGGQGGPGRVTRRLRLVGGSVEKSLWLGGELPWGSCVGRTGFTECSGPSTNWNVGLWFTLVKNVMTMRAEHWAKAGPF